MSTLNCQACFVNVDHLQLLIWCTRPYDDPNVMAIYNSCLTALTASMRQAVTVPVEFFTSAPSWTDDAVYKPPLFPREEDKGLTDNSAVDDFTPPIHSNLDIKGTAQEGAAEDIAQQDVSTTGSPTSFYSSDGDVVTSGLPLFTADGMIVGFPSLTTNGVTTGFPQLSINTSELTTGFSPPGTNGVTTVPPPFTTNGVTGFLRLSPSTSTSDLTTGFSPPNPATFCSHVCDPNAGRLQSVVLGPLPPRYERLIVVVEFLQLHFPAGILFSQFWKKLNTASKCEEDKSMRARLKTAVDHYRDRDFASRLLHDLSTFVYIDSRPTAEPDQGWIFLPHLSTPYYHMIQLPKYWNTATQMLEH
ncbi:hypothetical protein OC835_004921 [Tilletia horrida]|nr:hypothetical protein OC835_004921 [Tilletia horrida]